MKLYLFLCISLTLAYRGFGGNIEILNTESTPKLTEDLTVMSNTERSINSKEITGMPITINTSEPTENTETMTTEITFNSNEDTFEANIPEPNCTENMRPYFWDPKENIWRCICKRPFFHVLMNNTCVELFSRGPCEPGNFIVQPQIGSNKTAGPRCAPNPCLEDDLVPYNGSCYSRTSNSVCNYGYRYFDETASEIRCVYLQSRPRTVINVPKRPKCPVDSRTDKHGRCRRKL